MNASVLLAGLATTTLWTALLEPLLTSSRWKRSEIALGVIITVGLLQISRAEADHLVPLLLGLASAIAAASKKSERRRGAIASGETEREN